jgi:hypothetical protein
MGTMNIKHTAKSSALLKQCIKNSTTDVKTAPLTSVVLGIPHFSQVFPNKNRTLPKAMQHGFNPILSIYVMCCKKRIELKHHAVSL